MFLSFPSVTRRVEVREEVMEGASLGALRFPRYEPRGKSMGMLYWDPSGPVARIVLEEMCSRARCSRCLWR